MLSHKLVFKLKLNWPIDKLCNMMQSLIRRVVRALVLACSSYYLFGLAEPNAGNKLIFVALK